MNTTGKPVDISKYPLVKQAYELCLAIEELPACKEQTALSIKAIEVKDDIWNLLEQPPCALTEADKKWIDAAWLEYKRTHPVRCE